MTLGWNETTLRRLVRDVALAFGLLLLTWHLWGMAAARGPQFQLSEIHSIEADVVGFTKVDVREQAASPRNNSSVLRTRSALQLEGYPPNLAFYLPGSPWRMENDIPVGASVRLEVLDDPAALAAHAREYPDTTFAQAMTGLTVDGDVRSSASETIARAENAAGFFRRASLAAGAVALTWISWAAWRWRAVLATDR